MKTDVPFIYEDKAFAGGKVLLSCHFTELTTGFPGI